MVLIKNFHKGVTYFMEVSLGKNSISIISLLRFRESGINLHLQNITAFYEQIK